MMATAPFSRTKSLKRFRSCVSGNRVEFVLRAESSSNFLDRGAWEILRLAATRQPQHRGYKAQTIVGPFDGFTRRDPRSGKHQDRVRGDSQKRAVIASRVEASR